MRKRRSPESDIREQILHALVGRTDLRAWRSNAGAARRGRRLVRFGMPGQGDISGILMGGRRLEIEVKSETGRQSKKQLAFEAVMRKYGGLYILARSVEDVFWGLRNA